jgi:hypothetical protein
MRQTAAEDMRWCRQNSRFSVPLPSTASFDRLLPMPWRFAVARAGQKRDSGLEIAGNPANAGLIFGNQNRKTIRGRIDEMSHDRDQAASPAATRLIQWRRALSAW